MSTIARANGSTFAVCFASLHGDGDVWLDAILGTFGGASNDDHVTFGCHVKRSAKRGAPVITSVDAATAFTYRPVMGAVLTRDMALKHERLSDLWKVVDLLLVGEPLVRSFLYGAA